MTKRGAAQAGYATGHSIPANHNAFQEVHMIIKIKPIHRYEVTVNLENGNAGPQVAASNLTKAQAQNIAWALHDRAAKHHDEPEGIDVTLIDESQ